MKDTSYYEETYSITSVYEWYDDVPRRLFNLYDYEHPPENLDSLTPKYTVNKKLGTSIILAGDQESASEGVLGKVIESFTHGFQYRNLDNLTFGLYGISNDEWDWAYTEKYSTSFILGGMTADLLGLTAGIFEMVAGLTEITGGTALSSTGAGAVIGVPLISVGSATVAVGVATAGTSLGNLGKDTKTLADDLYIKAKDSGVESKPDLPNQGTVQGTIEVAPPVDAGKQGKHVPGHPNDIAGKSQWKPGGNGVDETQRAWQNGVKLPDGTRVWDTGKVVGQNGETGVRVHIDSKGRIHGYPVNPGQYLK